jgi:hypothetical protein
MALMAQGIKKRQITSSKPLVTAIFGAQFHMLLKLEHFRQWMRNNWRVLKCGAGGGWRKSIGLIMQRMK